MPFTKAKACHGSCFLVYRYLTGEGTDRERAVGADLQNLPEDVPWWKVMDDTRATYGHDAPTRRGKARSYSHYIIAPDPKDFEGMDRDEALRRVRAVASGWAKRYLGEYQVAIVYHDDGANGNIHAHLVANVSNLATGRKRQESDADWERAKRYVDELAREVGLHALADRVADEEAYVSDLLEDLNHEREARGEIAVPRGLRLGASTTQDEVRGLAERALNARRRKTWKDEVRVAADEAAYVATSFESFQRAMRHLGFDVYQNRRGQLVYVHSDGTHRCRDSKVGLMYQTDLLATRFMDLRFTRAAYAARRGEYRFLGEQGIRVPKVSLEGIHGALKVWGAYGVGSVEEAGDAIARMRANANALSAELDRREGLAQAIARDIADRELVERGAALIEPWRTDGRIDVGCPQPVETVRAYEAARKRLARRGYATDLGTLSALLDVYRDAADETRGRLEEIARSAEELMRATATTKAVNDYVTAGAAFEQRRYGGRLAHAAAAQVGNFQRRRGRPTFALDQRVATWHLTVPEIESNVVNTWWYRRQMNALLTPPPAAGVTHAPLDLSPIAAPVAAGGDEAAEVRFVPDVDRSATPNARQQVDRVAAREGRARQVAAERVEREADRGEERGA